MSISLVKFKESNNVNGIISAEISQNGENRKRVLYEALLDVSHFFQILDCSRGSMYRYLVIGGNSQKNLIANIFQEKKINYISEKALPAIQNEYTTANTHLLLTYFLAYPNTNEQLLTLGLVASLLNFKEALTISKNFNLFQRLLFKMPGLARQLDWSENTLLCLVLGNIESITAEIEVLLFYIIKQLPQKWIDQRFKLTTQTALHQCCHLANFSRSLLFLLLAKGANPLMLGAPFFFADPKILGLKFVQEQVSYSRYLPDDGILPTLAELQLKSQSPVIASNLYWAMQAVFYVSREGVIGPRNCPTTVEKTGGWSLIHGDRLHREFRKYVDVNNLMINTAYHFKKADLFREFRGGGDCTYQASAAFVYLLKKGIQVEYFHLVDPNTKEEGCIHHFLVLSRDPASPEENPSQWGHQAVICDPFERSAYQAIYYYLPPREYLGIRRGNPQRKLAPQEIESCLKDFNNVR